jgi:hypothetical protein
MWDDADRLDQRGDSAPPEKSGFISRCGPFAGLSFLAVTPQTPALTAVAAIPIYEIHCTFHVSRHHAMK